ncbi:glutathione S-transferase family protein [Peristeroidobacter agariperforans]|uniref:glutathione S-transferase family protein n=1 Tax=Peristeroidobacter agariperforans TaxID=268404 RepID=UPI00101CF952|nr:glutathione S-transferase family protein [Peristeroidobacter agariperforans]
MNQPAAKIELWHCADTRSFRVLWVLEELRLPYQLHLLPFPPRARMPEYLEINPLGTIPSMRDGDTFMTESAGIVQYLATRHAPNELVVGVEDRAYGSWLNWLHFGEATLTFPQTLIMRYRKLEPGRAEQVADDYARWFMSRLRQVDRTLQATPWLCAGRFTAADISVGYALLLADFLELSSRFPQAVAEYWLRLQARPAFQAAKGAQKGSLAAELASLQHA